jgi:hypothetical protein
MLQPRLAAAEVPVGLLKAERRGAGLGGRDLEELEAGQPSQVLGVPFPQLRVLWTSGRQWGSSRRRR